MVPSIAASPPLFWSQVALAASLRYWRPLLQQQADAATPCGTVAKQLPNLIFSPSCQTPSPPLTTQHLTPHCPSQCRQPARRPRSCQQLRNLRRLQHSFPDASPKIECQLPTDAIANHAVIATWQEGEPEKGVGGTLKD